MFGFRPTITEIHWRFWVAWGLTCATLGSACDDDAAASEGAEDSGGMTFGSTTADTASSAATTSTTGDTAGPGLERWIVGGWISTDDDYTGYLTVVDDLSSHGSIDLSRVVEFGGDMIYASPGGGVVYVGFEQRSTIQRWEADESNGLTMTGEVSLANVGVTSTLGRGRNVIQFVNEQRAYYFDAENLQVVVFNPASMATEGSFSIEGLHEDGQDVGLNFIHRDGDRFIMTARYWSLVDETATSLTRAVIVNSGDDSVAYIDDTRCGNVAFNVTDTLGNVYLGSHPAQAASIAAGIAGTDPSPSCILRINTGENQFDPNYFVDLGQLSGGVAGGLLQGIDDHAYLFHYSGGPITSDGLTPTLRGDDWSLYSLKLGDEANTYARVQGLGDSFTAYGTSFTTVVNGIRTPYVVAVEADFSGGQYYDVSSPLSAVQGLSFPGFPGEAIAIH